MAKVISLVGSIARSSGMGGQSVRRRLSGPANFLIFLVGVAGFEPATPSSRTMCATRLRYTPRPDRGLIAAAHRSASAKGGNRSPKRSFRAERLPVLADTIAIPVTHDPARIGSCGRQMPRLFRRREEKHGRDAEACRRRHAEYLRLRDRGAGQADAAFASTMRAGGSAIPVRRQAAGAQPDGRAGARHGPRHADPAAAASAPTSSPATISAAIRWPSSWRWCPG